MFVVTAFYRFVTIESTVELRSQWLERCEQLGLCGTILLAPEGINGTVGGSREAIDGLYDIFESDPRFRGIEYKESFSEKWPFGRFKIRLKKEIITMRRPEANPNVVVGKYVEAKDWNAVISDPEVVLVDTRNDYEVVVGTFKGAIDPQTESFGEFPAWVDANLSPDSHPKVAMFCTGGIRCEKATAYLLQKGFKEVYHLKGGILKYLEEVPQDQSLYEGECFVFDEREAVGHGLEPRRAGLDERVVPNEVKRLQKRGDRK